MHQNTKRLLVVAALAVPPIALTICTRFGIASGSMVGLTNLYVQINAWLWGLILLVYLTDLIERIVMFYRITRE